VRKILVRKILVRKILVRKILVRKILVRKILVRKILARAWFGSMTSSFCLSITHELDFAGPRRAHDPRQHWQRYLDRPPQ
jgi:hypothetical protein